MCAHKCFVDYNEKNFLEILLMIVGRDQHMLKQCEAQDHPPASTSEPYYEMVNNKEPSPVHMEANAAYGYVEKTM